MNKRGLDNALVFWIMGAIVAVVVGVIILSATGKISLPFLYAAGSLPGVETIVLTACENVVELPGDSAKKNEYCNVLRDTKDKNYKVTCQFLQSKGKVKSVAACDSKVEVNSQRLCDETFEESLRVSNNINSKLYVNGLKCVKGLTCEDLGGREVAEATCPSDQTYVKIEGLKNARTTGSCCVPQTS